MDMVNAVANHHADCGGDSLTQIVQIADTLTTDDLLKPQDSEVDSLILHWRERFGCSKLITKIEP
jgi:hypothetical protein